METWSVSSSAISKIGYDESTHQMRITFTSGSTYTYQGVPPSVVDAFLSAGSKGWFYHNRIKGRY